MVGLERSIWFAELESAIGDAQELAWRIGVTGGDNAEAKHLYARLEVLRGELDLLRNGSGWTAARPHAPRQWAS